MKEIKPATSRIFSRLGSCGVFGIAMTDLADECCDLAVVTADLCFFSGLERFSAAHPDMFYNVGIAEQNLVGVAAGMASEGLVTFATTYASFAASRALDQVRVNMGYMGLPIKLIGLTSGFSTGILGATHMSIEDLAVMRSIPNMTVLSPADGIETYKMVLESAKYPGPVYIRLSGAMNNPIVYKTDYELEIGKAIELVPQGNVALIATGTMVYQALKAAEILKEKGILCRVIDMHTIKPLDKACIMKLANETELLVTVEEHTVLGGLGSAVVECLSETKHAPLLKIGVPDEFSHAGSYDYLIRKYGLDAEHIAERVFDFVKKNIE